MNLNRLTFKQVLIYRGVGVNEHIPAYEWEDHPTRLSWKDFVPAGRQIEKGTKIRVNHNTKYCNGESNCLQIRRLRNGVIGAKCFRCGRWGTYKHDKDVDLPVNVNGRWFKNILYEGVTNEEIFLPLDLELKWDNWPVEARSFLRHARIDEVVSFVRNIGYSPSLGKVILPLYEYSDDKNQQIIGSKLIGYQLRRVFKDDKAPKYTTRKSVKNYFAHSHKTDSVCVVVEDYLSFIRCSKFVSTVCLFGTSMSHAVVKALSTYDKVIIFLDNDNNIVKRQQMEMQRELENWIDDVKILSSDKQPKEYTDATLIQAIDVPY